MYKLSLRLCQTVFERSALSVTSYFPITLVDLTLRFLVHQYLSELVPGWQDLVPETCIDNNGLLDLSYN
jgi:hypothetical protein